MAQVKQKEIFEYIQAYYAANGEGPTLEEIRDEFQFASTSTAHHHVKRLEKQGLLSRDPNRARSIVPNTEPSMVHIPIRGQIAAGQPIEAIEDTDQEITLARSDVPPGGNYYALTVSGDSMIEDGIFDGDTVVIREQSSADNGQTVVAIIDDNQATLKRIYKEKGRFRLQPANQSLLPLYRDEVEIRGVVVKIVRDLSKAPTEAMSGSKANGAYRELRQSLEELNLQQYHFVNSNDICTPMGCVEEMVDSIPDSFWKQKKLSILDPCAGNGNFHAYIQTKTPLENLVFNDINTVRLDNVRRLFGKRAKILCKDFFEFPDKEEYDLVVANPPYAKFTNGQRTAKNHNLSRDFILKALSVTKPGGYILFIVPDNWMSFSDSNRVPATLSRYQFIHLNIHGAKKWFPQVGSSFTWFLLQKTQNKSAFTVENFYKIRKTEEASVEVGVNFIPLFYSDTVRSILNKTVNAKGEKYTIETSSNLHKYTQKDLLSDVKDAHHQYKIHHTPSQVVWSVRPHKYQAGWKVFISLTNQFSTFIDKDSGMTQSIAFIRCSSKKEAERISKELNSPLYLFLNNITRYGNFNNIRVLQNLPVYQDFNLTNTEKQCIEEFNQAYYRSKPKR